MLAVRILLSDKEGIMPELEQYKGIIIPAIIIIAIIFFMFAAGYRKAPPDKAFIISGLRRKAKVDRKSVV